MNHEHEQEHRSRWLAKKTRLAQFCTSILLYQNNPIICNLEYWSKYPRLILFGEQTHNKSIEHCSHVSWRVLALVQSLAGTSGSNSTLKFFWKIISTFQCFWIWGKRKQCFFIIKSLRNQRGPSTLDHFKIPASVGKLWMNCVISTWFSCRVIQQITGKDMKHKKFEWTNQALSADRTHPFNYLKELKSD